jgi:hypothetical protein
MATTTNFGWETPDDTDLVKDGALAMRTLGNAIDTSLVDLKGGTTGQVLAKATNTDMDFQWVAVDPLTILDAKGDLISATAADTPARLAVGTNGQVLTADSTTSTGLKWATASSGALTLISTTTLSSVASQSFNNVFTSTYRNYQIAINLSGTHSGTNLLALRFRASSTDATTSYQSRLQSLNTNTSGSTSFDYNDQSSTYLALGYLKWNSDPQLSGIINITNPQVAQASGLSGIMTGGDYYGVAPVSSLSMGILANTTAYDGFTLYPTGGGNLNGVVSIYGVSK